MTNLNTHNMTQLEINTMIKEKVASFTDSKAMTDQTNLKIPRQLNNKKKDALLEIAFRYLFHLNIARQTETPLEVENLRAIEGNRLVKKKHPLNIFYDFQFVAAKTQIKSYLHNTSITVNYNLRALRIYGRCFLFAQLDAIAQSGSVPDKLGKAFYFLPKGSFIDEFEQMNQLALNQFIPQLSPKDTIHFQPIPNDTDHDFNHTAFLLNDKLILVDTNEKGTSKEKELKDLFKLFFLQNVKQKEQPSEIVGSFSQVGIYRARYGEMITLDIRELFED